MHIVIYMLNPCKIVAEDSFSIIPAKDKLTNKELVVIVQSRPDAFEARQSNRDTWAKTGVQYQTVIFRAVVKCHNLIYKLQNAE